MEKPILYRQLKCPTHVVYYVVYYVYVYLYIPKQTKNRDGFGIKSDQYFKN